MAVSKKTRRQRYEAILEARLDALETLATTPETADCEVCGAKCGHRAKEFNADHARELKELYALQATIVEEDAEVKRSVRGKAKDEDVQAALDGIVVEDEDGIHGRRGPRGPHQP